MKKSLALLLTLALICSFSTMTFAEETATSGETTTEPTVDSTTEPVSEPTLEEQIASLEQEIADYNLQLLDESLSEEDILAIQLLLDDSALILNSLVEEQEALIEEDLLTELTALEEALELLKATDTSEMTEEEIDALSAQIIALEDDLTAKQSVYDEMTAPTFEEQVADLTLTVDALKSDIALLEEAMLNGALTEEQLAQFEAQLQEKQAALESTTSTLNTLISEHDTTIEEERTNPNIERFQNAERLGITPGKMNLLERLGTASESDDFDYDTWSDKSVKDIMSEIKAYRKGYAQDDATETSEEVFEETDEIDARNEEIQTTSESKSNGNGKSGNARGKNK